MSRFVEVKFKGQRTGIYENTSNLLLKKGELVIVEAGKGVDLGRVNHFFDTVESEDELKKILRKATTDEMMKFRQNRINEEKALENCRGKVKKHHLNMQLVDCEYQFDGNKITFYFTSDQRVDFRELVKDLAAQYRTRIELRQIGVRDAAKRLGGYGVCGLKMCCTAWMRSFTPISTQAAKDQNLPLNPNRLAGVCGRLKCCLMYERDFYNWATNKYPQLAKEIETEKGRGIIDRIDILKEEVLVKYESGEMETLSLSLVQEKYYQCNKTCERRQSLQDINAQAAAK
ncbi:MAG: regulatory iron-sulfur-containing complex subunit RicT [candidate division KSB1 bacterium]|nr:regulatory iron-sulfur-containing complex subunit RicT [candidate division KSB1 bacterium]